MTQQLLRTAILGVFSGIVLCAASKSTTVEMKNAQGQSVGTAKLTQKSGSGVTLKISFKGLPPGEHALHFHSAAKCDAPDFKSAGPHFNPDNKHHGLENPEGPHAGDMPNFMVKAGGTAKATIRDPRVSLDEAGHSLYSNGGTALIIHAKPDDLKSDPAGNAGDRIACGTITK